MAPGVHTGIGYISLPFGETCKPRASLDGTFSGCTWNPSVFSPESLVVVIYGWLSSSTILAPRDVPPLLRRSSMTLF